MFEMYKTPNLEYNKVNFWKKFAAFIIDIIIINILIISNFTSSLSRYFGKLSMQDALNDKLIIPEGTYFMIFIMMVLVLVYFTFFDYYLGQTPGKMILKIKTVEFDSSGNIKSSITFSRAIFRNCYVLPFFPFYIFWIIEPIYLGLYNERLLERLSNTRTIDLNSEFKNNSKIKSYKDYKLDKV